MVLAIFLLIAGFLLIAWGIFTVRNPAFGWRMNEGWKVKGESEPSYSYMERVKIGGVVTIVMGSLFIVGGILNLL